MIFIIFVLRQSGYIATMLLLLTKRNVQLQVCYAPPTVRVLPLLVKEEDERLLGTMARNEELLLLSYLKETELYNPSWQLPQYFEGKGWQVELAETLLPDK